MNDDNVITLPVVRRLNAPAPEPSPVKAEAIRSDEIIGRVPIMGGDGEVIVMISPNGVVLEVVVNNTVTHVVLEPLDAEATGRHLDDAALDFCKRTGRTE